MELVGRIDARDFGLKDFAEELVRRLLDPGGVPFDQLLVSHEWREDKECSRLFFAPKGHDNLAQGFNPGNRISPAKSPERAPDRMRY